MRQSGLQSSNGNDRINVSKHRGVSVVKTMEDSMRRIRNMMILVSLLGCMCGCQKQEVQSLSLETVEVENGDEKSNSEASIFVYVCGAVAREGVYELPAGSRAYEAVEMAGGFREDAATTELNQAQVLEDETRLYVPTLAELEERQKKSDGKVNLNTASKEELMSLPGVGESRAESIVKYREAVGSFQKVEDIMQVSGIKEGLFSKIKEFIKV